MAPTQTRSSATRPAPSRYYTTGARMARRPPASGALPTALASKSQLMARRRCAAVHVHDVAARPSVSHAQTEDRADGQRPSSNTHTECRNAACTHDTRRHGDTYTQKRYKRTPLYCNTPQSMGKCASKPSVEESALTERLTGITELLQQIQADQRKATTQDLDATTPVTLQQTPTQIAVLALRDAAIAAAEGGDAAADVRKLAKSAIDRVASLESKVEVAPPANANDAVMDVIKALEDRIKTLEAQLASGAMVAAKGESAKPAEKPKIIRMCESKAPRMHSKAPPPAGGNGGGGVVEDFSTADKSKWDFPEQLYGGAYRFVSMGETECVAAPIKDGIDQFKALPDKYAAMVRATGPTTHCWPTRLAS